MFPHCWSRLVKRHAWPEGRARVPTSFLRLEALENRTVPTTLVVSPGGIVPGSFSSVQAAVNAANPAGGDTVQVNPGIYTEQVTITKSLTIQGNGAGAIINAPSTLNPDTFSLRVLVEVGNAATVNINNMTIQGPNPAINAGLLVVGGATANVTRSTVADIHQNAAGFGVQTGAGIQVGGTGSQAVGQVGNATITNCTVTNYQKVGIVIGRNGSSGTITGCTITGIGPTTLIAQNGIQIGPGAAAGAAVSNNTISGNQFTGTSNSPDPFNTNQSAGILNFIDSCSITGNTFFGNDVGIYSANSGSTSTGTTISGNTVRDNRFEDIELGPGTATVSNNTITGSNFGVAVLASVLDQFGNPVTADAQATLVSNNITDNGNGGLSVPGAGIGLLVQSGAPKTALATAHFNRIAGNSVGLDNTTTATVDATNNWWGSNAGPGGAGSDTVSGPVTFNPWLVLQVTASPTSVPEGGVAVVVASMTTNSAGTNTSALGHVPDGIPVSFGATLGTIVPSMGFTAGGEAAAQFTAGNTAGTATVSATVDHQTGPATVTIEMTTPPSGVAAGPLVVSGPANGVASVFVPNAAGQYGTTPAVNLVPFPGMTVSLRTAVADVDGDGIPDTILVTGPGTPIRFAVISGKDNTTELIPPTAPFAGSESFTGGGFVAAADIDGDGKADIVVTSDEGGGPRVTIFSLVNGAATVKANFFGIDDPNFRGGARAALGDVNHDGTPDLAVAAGFLGGPRVALFDGKTLFSGTPTRLVNDFFAFPGSDATTLRNGVFVSIGDINGDGFGDLIFGGGPGGAPRVFVLSGALVSANNVAGAQAAPVANFFVAGNTSDRGGVRVAAKDADGDARADLAVGSGEGSPAKVRVYLGKNFTSSAEPGTFQDLSVFGGAALPGGVFVG
jgi:parallel beta-helix repeat protein